MARVCSRSPVTLVQVSITLNSSLGLAVGRGGCLFSGSQPLGLFAYFGFGTLVLSKNIRDSWQGLRQTKIRNRQVSKSSQENSPSCGWPLRILLATDSPKPPAFSLGGFLLVVHVRNSDPHVQLKLTAGFHLNGNILDSIGQSHTRPRPWCSISLSVTGTNYSQRLEPDTQVVISSSII